MKPFSEDYENIQNEIFIVLYKGFTVSKGAV